MLDLNEMGKMSKEEREKAIDNHAKETVAEVKKSAQSIGGMMVRMMIQNVERSMKK